MEKITFREWANIWLETYKKGTVKVNTYKMTYYDTFRLYLIPQFGEMRLDEITRKNIVEYMVDMSYKYSQTVLSKIRICLHSMYSAAVEEKLVEYNPANNLKIKSYIPKIKKSTYSEKEAKILFDYASTHRYGLGICIMLDTGLRCSEMLGLKWDDVDFDNGWLFVNRASVAVNGKAFVSTPKSESSRRVIPISHRLVSLLADKKYSKNESDYIVPAPSGMAYTPANYTRNRYNVFFDDCNAEIGLHRLSPHELRHTCGTLLYQRSGDIYAVSKYLGHCNVDITSKFYIHSSPEILRNRLSI